MKKKLLILLTCLFNFISCSFDEGGVNSDATPGSLNRFVISGQYMYTLDIDHLNIFDITDQENPVLRRTIEIKDDLQTLTVYQGSLYIGAGAGLYIININNPLTASVNASIAHWVSKDPVVVSGKYLYSTTRNNWSGALTIYEDLGSDQFNELNRIILEQPYGLGISGDYLFVCEDINGILVYDISKRDKPIKVQTYTSIISPRDVIILNDIMFCSAKNEFQLVDIKDPRNPRLISIIK
ncbi:MAG: hypothetical protein ABIO44_13865 [Saprospiraceae bacterium]